MKLSKLSPELRSVVTLVGDAMGGFEVLVGVADSADAEQLRAAFGVDARIGGVAHHATLSASAIGRMSEQEWVESISLVGRVIPLDHVAS